MAFTNLGLSGPEPRKRSAPPPPFGKKPEIAIAVGVGPKKPIGAMDHEDSETPEAEGAEESGAKLISAIDAICDRQTAGKLFAAIADALGGSDDEPPAADLGDGMGDME